MELKLSHLDALDTARRRVIEATIANTHPTYIRKYQQEYADLLVVLGEALANEVRTRLNLTDCPECRGSKELWYVGKDEDVMDGPRRHVCHACDGTGKRGEIAHKAGHQQ